MASETERHVALHLPWATLTKIVAAIAVVAVWLRLWWILLLVVAAVLVAVALTPVVDWLNRHGCPRWLAASGAVFVPIAAFVGFLVLSWASLAEEAQNLSQQLTALQQELKARLPQSLLDFLSNSSA